MCFFDSREFVSKICLYAVDKGIVAEAKHSRVITYFYGEDFHAEIKLADFIDLNTGVCHIFI